MKKLISEFKEFIMRGNVLDMAVGVIIATAFGKITTSLVNDVFMPLISWIFGARDMTALNVIVRPAELDAAVDGTLPEIRAHEGGIVTAAQKIPFLRLMYTKYFKGTNEAVAAAAGTAEPVSEAAYEAALARLLKKIGEVSAAHNIKTILVYTPTVRPDAAGNIVTDARPGEREAFERLSAENGLVFLDLTAQNTAAVTEGRRLPFGFANTAPGEGHINRLGLRIFADAVFDAIEEGEG